MGIPRWAIIVLMSALAVVGTVTFAAREDTAETSSPVGQRPSVTQVASCIVRITVDAGLLPLNPGTIESLIHSSGVVGKAAREVLGLDADTALDLEENIEIQWLSGATQGLNAPPAQSGPAGLGEHGEAMNPEDVYGAGYTSLYGSRPIEAPQEQEKSEEPDRADRPPGLGGRADRNVRRLGTDPMMPGGTYGGTPGVRRRTAVRADMMGDGLYGGSTPGGAMMGGMGAGTYGRWGDLYGMPMAATQTPGTQQTVTLILSVHLPDGVKPVAVEFLNALVANLRTTLTDAHGQYADDLGNLLRLAERRREEAYAQLGGKGDTSSPERRMVEEQLETFVDLSMLSPEMPLSEAIDFLKHSVEPPLQIVVMWRDLLENAEIEPTTPTHMDSLPNVKVRTALDVLLQAMYNPFVAELAYDITGNVLTIGTVDAIEEMPELMALPYDESDLLALRAQRRDLAGRVQRVEMDLATMTAREKAIAEQIARAQREMDAALAEDTVIQELEKLIELDKVQLANVEQMAGAGRASSADLTQAKENLAKARIELAQRRDERSRILGDRVRQFNSDLSLMAVERAEKQAQQDLLRAQVDELQRELAEASVFDPDAMRIRTTRNMIDQIESRIAGLQTRLANLQPPTVTMIGAR